MLLQTADKPRRLGYRQFTVRVCRGDGNDGKDHHLGKTRGRSYLTISKALYAGIFTSDLPDASVTVQSYGSYI